jgi:DNA-binding MarR family transcriptional regulator
MNGVLATLERQSLIERQQHPTHGRILQVTMTGEGRRRLEAADRAMRGLRRAIVSARSDCDNTPGARCSLG